MPIPLTAPREQRSAPVTALPRILRPQRAVPSDAIRPTRAEVSLTSLRHNLHCVQKLAGDAQVWAVLKADGYGHGSKAVARTLERAGVRGVCVALLEEGIELREAGIRVPILVMGGYYGRAWAHLFDYALTPVVHSADQVEALAAEAHYLEKTIAVHVKVDTGMGRLGALPRDVAELGTVLKRHPEVRLEGLMTHFACADSGDSESIDHQLDLFDGAHRTLCALGLVPSLRHAANSAALLAGPRASLDMVRPGIALFGVEPRRGTARELRPVMRVRSEIVALRELVAGQSVGYGGTWTARRTSRVATLPMGYADGLVRGLSNHGDVLIRGRRAPIVGVVSMDMTMVDVTEILDAQVGDECVILGTQKAACGKGTISAHEIAERIGSIPWEVLTNISRRVPRFYRES